MDLVFVDECDIARCELDVFFSSMEQTTSRYGPSPTHDEVLESLGREESLARIADQVA